MGKIADGQFLYFIPIFVLLALLLRKPKIGIFFTFIFFQILNSLFSNPDTHILPFTTFTPCKGSHIKNIREIKKTFN